jgi:hypothetical protein
VIFSQLEVGKRENQRGTQEELSNRRHAITHMLIPHAHKGDTRIQSQHNRIQR